MPTHFNPEGEEEAAKIPQKLIDEIRHDILVLTSGATVYGSGLGRESSVAGVWIDDGGKMYSERVIVISADGSALMTAFHSYFLRKIGKRMAEALGQESIYYSRQPIDVEYIDTRPFEPIAPSDHTVSAEHDPWMDKLQEMADQGQLPDECVLMAETPWPVTASGEYLENASVFILVSKELVLKYEPSLFKQYIYEYIDDKLHVTAEGLNRIMMDGTISLSDEYLDSEGRSFHSDRNPFIGPGSTQVTAPITADKRNGPLDRS